MTHLRDSLPGFLFWTATAAGFCIAPHVTLGLLAVLIIAAGVTIQ